MTHLDNVQALCDKHGLPNPIPPERLWAQRVEFLDSGCSALAIIDGTPMNCASRLLLQELSEKYGNPIIVTEAVRQELKSYFGERWDGDWSPDRRPMMHWLNDIFTSGIMVHPD